MNTVRRSLLSTSTVFAACAGITGWLGNASAATQSTSVSFSGRLTAPRSFSAQDLKALPPTVVDFTGPDGKLRKYTGVLLRDLLAVTKPDESDHNALRQSYVLAKGTDNYFALFTWAELHLSPIGDGAFVVYLRDGQPLSADEGAIALVSARDSRPGPRYVKWLSSVEFRRAVA